MGTVVSATPTQPDRLLIDRLASGGQDVFVEYYVSQGKLVRKDNSTGVAVPIAANVSGFSAETPGDSIVRLVVTVTCGTVTRQATLLWSPP